jgi:hypothetical protein
MSKCRSKTPAPIGFFYCSRERGHAGTHAAHGLQGVVVKRWSRTKEPKP